jgi:hypothetical protein
MSRGPQTFRQRDVTRAVKAVLAAGVTVTAVRVDRDGAIVVSFEKPGKILAEYEQEANEWDRI